MKVPKGSHLTKMPGSLGPRTFSQSDWSIRWFKDRLLGCLHRGPPKTFLAGNEDLKKDLGYSPQLLDPPNLHPS